MGRQRYIVPKTLYISPEQDEWFKTNMLNFSQWVRRKIDIEMPPLPKLEVKTDENKTT